MVIFEFFLKAMPPSLSESKVLPSFCFAFKIPDDRAASNIYEPFLTLKEIPCLDLYINLRSSLDFITLEKGFRMKYEVQSCGGLITEDLADIQSPTHMTKYLHNLNCTWTIQAPAGKVVELK